MVKKLGKKKKSYARAPLKRQFREMIFLLIQPHLECYWESKLFLVWVGWFPRYGLICVIQRTYWARFIKIPLFINKILRPYQERLILFCAHTEHSQSNQTFKTFQKLKRHLFNDDNRTSFTNLWSTIESFSFLRDNSPMMLTRLHLQTYEVQLRALVFCLTSKGRCA